MPAAYARMNARRKIPVGQRDRSSRSRASKKLALIFVLAEMDDRAICRRSRSRRRRPPNVSSFTTIISTGMLRATSKSRSTPTSHVQLFFHHVSVRLHVGKICAVHAGAVLCLRPRANHTSKHRAMIWCVLAIFKHRFIGDAMKTLPTAALLLGCIGTAAAARPDCRVRLAARPGQGRADAGDRRPGHAQGARPRAVRTRSA